MLKYSKFWASKYWANKVLLYALNLKLFLEFLVKRNISVYTYYLSHANKQNIRFSTNKFTGKEETFSPIMVIKQVQPISKDEGQLPHQQHSVAAASGHEDSFSSEAVVWPEKSLWIYYRSPTWETTNMTKKEKLNEMLSIQ